MKRINIFSICIVIAVLAVLFAACGKNTKQDNIYEYNENTHQYEFDEMVRCFDVSKNGMIYRISSCNVEEMMSDVSDYRVYSNLDVLDETGEVTETLKIPGCIDQIQLEEEEKCLYYIDVEDWNHKMLYRYDLVQQTEELIWEIPEGVEIDKFFNIDGEIYVYGISKVESSINVGFKDRFVGKVD